MFIQGQIYERKMLHQLYGGQRQGGICTPIESPFILLFAGEQGHQYGYHDGWNENGIYLYTGEGQIGDMAFVRGNRAIRDHIDNGKDLHLFEYTKKGQLRYIGQMVYIGYQEKQGIDKNGNSRNIIVFELVPIALFSKAESNDVSLEASLWNETLENLRQRALSLPIVPKEAKLRKQWVRDRRTFVRTYILKRANGKCEACGTNAPFLTNDNRPYLEPHHIRKLSDGGPDHPYFMIALCPNCHRRAHFSKDSVSFNDTLMKIISEKEKTSKYHTPRL